MILAKKKFTEICVPVRNRKKKITENTYPRRVRKKRTRAYPSAEKYGKYVPVNVPVNIPVNVPVNVPVKNVQKFNNDVIDPNVFGRDTSMKWPLGFIRQKILWSDGPKYPTKQLQEISAKLVKNLL